MSPAAGARQLEIEVKATVKEIEAAAISRATRGTNIMRNAAIEILGQDGGGRVYRGHVASAPGQPPAPDTGSLRDNWQEYAPIVSVGLGGVRIQLKIRSQMLYAGYLDRGTRKMKPRPFREKIREKSIPQVAALFGSI